MIKCKDGQRTCTHDCAERGFKFGADTVNKNLAIVNRNDKTVAYVAYVRGLEDHPQRCQSDTIAEIESAIFLTETP